MTVDAGGYARFLSVLRDLPLWLFVALALAGYAALFAPAFGHVDLKSFRAQWAGVFWLVAVTFTIFSVVRAGDLIVRTAATYFRDRAERKQQLNVRRYHELYLPLFEEISSLFITTSTGYGAPKLRHRLKNAWDKLHGIKSTKVAVMASWRALFDRQFLGETGEVDFGKEFPIQELKKIARNALAIADTTLMALIAAAERDRIESQIAGNYLTQQDIDLTNWLFKEHERLQKLASF